jgi:hypothetical protein
MKMEYCEVCGKAMTKTVWTDEAWGRPYTTIEWSCENPNCGEEEDEEESE